MDPEEIANRFGYHRADVDTAQRHATVRALCEQLAHCLNLSLPEGRDKSLALTKLQETMHWANSAIAMQSEVDPNPASPS